jgi:hypothetical protein
MLGMSYLLTAVRALAQRPSARTLPPTQAPSTPATDECLDGCSVLTTELVSNRGHGFIVGAPGTGKTTLIEQLFCQLPDCVVYLKVGPNALPGWQDAPFYGTFYPADGSTSYGEDLDDILRQRPAGRFQLDFPLTSIFGPEPVAVALKRGLAQSLIKSATEDHAAHLSVLIDDAELLVDELPMLELMTRSSSSWSLIACREDVKASEYRHAPYCRHVIGLQIPRDAAMVAEDTLGIPEGTLSAVPLGSFWHSTQKGHPGQQRKFSTQRPGLLPR